MLLEQRTTRQGGGKRRAVTLARILHHARVFAQGKMPNARGLEEMDAGDFFNSHYAKMPLSSRWL
jgi:hypothetical protein